MELGKFITYEQVEQIASPFCNCNPANPQMQIANCQLPAQKRLEPMKQIQPTLECKSRTRDTGSSCLVQPIAPGLREREVLQQGIGRCRKPGSEHEPELEPKVRIGCGLDVAGEVDIDLYVAGDASVDGNGARTRSCIQPQSYISST